jgi:hypothetical protein
MSMAKMIKHTLNVFLCIILIAFSYSCGKKNGTANHSTANVAIQAVPTGFKIDEILFLRNSDESYSFSAKSNITQSGAVVNLAKLPFSCKEIGFEIPSGLPTTHIVAYNESTLTFGALGDGDMYGIGIKQVSGSTTKNAIEALFSIKDTPYPPPGPRLISTHEIFTKKFKINQLKLTRQESTTVFKLEITLGNDEAINYNIQSIRLLQNSIANRGQALLIILNENVSVENLQFTQLNLNFAPALGTTAFTYCKGETELNPKYLNTQPVPVIVISNPTPNAEPPLAQIPWASIDFKKGMLWFK